ncbi:MAG: Hint domain-containing protein, partial [Proteobacteria bacterium]|nr:Hint domain-containing protein [Pseudomonadota bacterium]
VDGLTNSGVVTLSGTAEANSTITVSDNGTVVGTATANGSGAWSLTGINLINGNNTLTAKATDASGNTGAASGTFVATLDAGAPAAPSLTGISPDTGSSSTDGLTNSGIVSLSGTAEADSTVTVYNNGTIVGTTTVDAGGAWTLAGIDLVNGGNTLTARATDSAGNPGALSAGFTATLDSTPPAAPVIAALTSDVALLPGIVPNGSTTPDNDLTATVSLVNTNAKVGDVIQLFNGSGTGAPVGAAYTLTAPDIAAGSVILQTGPLVDHTTYSLTARLTDPADNQSVASPAYSAFVDTDLLCFLAGTLVMTPEGSRPVETLRRGDLVITAEGHAIPVRWLGRQTVSTRFGDPLRVMPIRIRAGALGDALPERDLWLSPDHAVLVDDILIHAGALVNGLSIMRDDSSAPTIIYYHVELATHQLILAEGISAETFIDNVDRMAFDNWEEHDAADQESAPITEMDLPRAKSHRQVPRRVRERLLARARELFGPLTEAA